MTTTTGTPADTQDAEVLIVATIEEAAALLGRDPSTVRKHIRKGWRRARRAEAGGWTDIEIKPHELARPPEADETAQAAPTPPPLPEIVTALLDEKDKRIQALEGEVLYLRDTLSREQVTANQALQQMRALMAPAQDPPAPARAPAWVTGLVIAVLVVAAAALAWAVLGH